MVRFQGLEARLGNWHQYMTVEPTNGLLTKRAILEANGDKGRFAEIVPVVPVDVRGYGWVQATSN